MAEFKFSNFGKPSNKKWKLVADTLLYALPAYTLLITVSPLPEGFRLWANFIISALVVTIKAITKLTIEPTIEEELKIK